MPDHKKRDKKDNEDMQPPAQAEPAVQGAADGDTQPVGSQVELYPAEDLEALRTELDGARTKSAEYFEGWQRERADFSNYRRRVERDQAQTYQNLQGSIVKKFLPIVDDLSRALKNRPENGDIAPVSRNDTGMVWANGIELIYRKLLSILESEGVHRMPAEKELFDPARHEAISMEPSPNRQSGEIIEVIQDGYLIGDRVLRPALVRVAS
jgi:molecular chaperone GrpE